MFLNKYFLTAATMVLFCLQFAGAHCQIPCGIYDDQMRFNMLREHITTMEKAMKKIPELSSGKEMNAHQMVRWVVNKEEHAQEFQGIVTAYFMAQRVKPADAKDKKATEKYLRKVTLLHELVFYAMKAKQTTDLEHIKKLKNLVDTFEKAYMGEKAKNHKH